MTRGRFLTSASKFSIEPNGGIFDVSQKINLRQAVFTLVPSISRPFFDIVKKSCRLCQRKLTSNVKTPSTNKITPTGTMYENAFRGVGGQVSADAENNKILPLILHEKQRTKQ